MLTDADIEFMKETRNEVVEKRRRNIDVIYIETQKDEYTGEPIGNTEVSREVLSVVTEGLSTAGQTITRKLEGGILYEEGDIRFSVDNDLIEDIADKITQARYDGKEYEILAKDKKGIGIRNRYELLGRVIT